MAYTVDLARGLADRGIEPVMAVLGPPPTEDKVQQANAIFGLRMVATGLPLDWTARTPDEILCAGAELAAIARETRADSVHLHTPSLARGEGVPESLLSPWLIPVSRPGGAPPGKGRFPPTSNGVPGSCKRDSPRLTR